MISYDAKNRLDAVWVYGPEKYRSLTLTWDVAGRLASTSDGASYRYDAMGRRVQKTAGGQTTVYHHDPSGRVIAETDLAGVKQRIFVYLGNKLVTVDGCAAGSGAACSERQWYHTDTLGSVLARTDATGTVNPTTGLVARLDYQPWGEQWSVTGQGGDRQYNGRVFDPGTGFHDYGARMYWPQIGRFISADSVMGSPGSPASLNRYSYVLNNPYRFVDPSGRWAEDVHLYRTADWAMSAGFSKAQASTIGNGDNAVDGFGGGKSPVPGLGDQSYHFSTNGPGQRDSRLQRFDQLFAKAIEIGREAASIKRTSSFLTAVAEELEQRSLELLGAALHPLQDIEAHSAGFVDDFMVGPVKAFKIHWTDAADKSGKRESAVERTRQVTTEALRKYQEAVGR